MIGLRSNFGASLVLAALVIAVGFGAAVSMRKRAASAGQPWLRTVARILTLTAVAIVVVTTALPTDLGISTDGDLVLELGRGGLRDWRAAMADPWRLSSIQLWANVMLYIPMGIGVVVGWPERRHLAPLVGIGLSITIEAMQFLVLGRVAAVDDVILNAAGAMIGYLVGLGLLRTVDRRRRNAV